MDRKLTAGAFTAQPKDAGPLDEAQGPSREDNVKLTTDEDRIDIPPALRLYARLS